MGTERRIVRWPALVDYYRAIAAASDRVRFEIYGDDMFGQPMVLLTISSPANLARAAEWQATQQRLADQRGLDEAERQRLMEEGRAVVLVTCSIHGTEIGGTQMTPDLVYRLAFSDDAEVHRVLDEVILLLVPSLNPGGLELVADWYERVLDTPFEGSNPPELYHPYAGHDNNRDWFMQTLEENRLTIQHVQNPWRPHIVFDLHQMGSFGPRYVVPPFIDPYDQNVDPILQAAVNDLGTSMARELTAAGKQGVATGIIFDAFSPSRAYQHYHGGVRILSEAASVRIATSIDITPGQLAEARGFDPRVALNNHPAPWPGGRWTMAEIVDHNRIAVWAVLGHAARFRDRWVAHQAEIQARSLVRDEPSAFVIPGPAEQGDPGTLADLVEVLSLGDVEVRQAGAAFEADGVEFPAGTFVVPMAQPFGGYGKTLLESQRYPDLRLYPGGPPRPPYDNTAHTLPLQLGVEAIPVRTGPNWESMSIVDDIRPAGGLRRGEGDAFLVSPRTNAGVALVNGALAAGAGAARQADDGGGDSVTGSWLLTGIDPETLDALAKHHHAEVRCTSSDMASNAMPVGAPRVGVYRSWRGAAIDSGWTELVLQRAGFAPTLLRDRDIRQGRLRRRYDAIVLPQEGARAIAAGNDPADYPAEYAGGLGDLGAHQLRRFVDEGGTLVVLDTASDYVTSALYLPVRNVLAGMTQREFYSPGSIVRVLLDTAHPLAWGYGREVAAMFVSSPAFEVRAGNGQAPVVVGQHALSDQLLSGWMHGAEQIGGRGALVDVPTGRGRVILFGFRPQYRAQARGTYRLLYNALYRSTMDL
jgi:hypothetical protein